MTTTDRAADPEGEAGSAVLTASGPSGPGSPGAGDGQKGGAGLDPGAALTIVVHGTPAPQGSKRARPIYQGSGALRVFTGKVAQEEMSQNLKPWRDDVKAAAETATAGMVRLDGPLAMSAVFTLRDKPHCRPTWWPIGVPWSRKLWWQPAGMPDLSKLIRSTEDALTTAGVWRDDARVVRYQHVAKVYEGDPGEPDALDRPGAVIRIWPLGGAT